MPDRDDPVAGAAARFAEAVEPVGPATTCGPAEVDVALTHDLEIVATLRALGACHRVVAFPDAVADVRADVVSLHDPTEWADAKARVRARVTAALAADLPPVDIDREPAPGGAVSHVAAGVGALVRRAPSLVGTTRRRRPPALSSTSAGRPAQTAPDGARRAAVVGAAALLVVITTAAGGILASRDAVPGDPLYGIKRAAEDAGGILDAGDGPQSRRDLHLAATRVDEIEQLTRGTPDPALLRSTIHDFGASAAAGSRLALAESADPRGGEQAAADLAAWASAQTARLSPLRAALPNPVRAAVDDVLRLLARVHDRALALTARTGCAQVTLDVIDDLGPLPATGPCVAPPRPAGTTAATSDSSTLASTPPEPTQAAGPSALTGSDSGGTAGAGPTAVSAATIPMTAAVLATPIPPASRLAVTTSAGDPVAPRGSTDEWAASTVAGAAAPTSRPSAPSSSPFPFTASSLPDGM